jgi:hypothetical protein
MNSKMLFCSIALALFGASSSGCPVGSGAYMSEDDARVHFSKNRQVFEAVVAEVRLCPGLRAVDQTIDRDYPGDLCADGGDGPPRKIQKLLRQIDVQWIVVSWKPVAEDVSESASLESINFVVYSRGLLTNGESISIAYSEVPEEKLNGDWSSLLPLPSQWLYHLSR